MRAHSSGLDQSDTTSYDTRLRYSLQSDLLGYPQGTPMVAPGLARPRQQYTKLGLQLTMAKCAAIPRDGTKWLACVVGIAVLDVVTFTFDKGDGLASTVEARIVPRGGQIFAGLDLAVVCHAGW